MALSLCRSILRRVISGIANAQFKICGKERRSLLYVKFPGIRSWCQENHEFFNLHRQRLGPHLKETMQNTIQSLTV